MFSCRFLSGPVTCVTPSCLPVPCKFHTGTISINSAEYTYTVQARSESGGKLLCEIRLVTRVGLDGDPWPIKNQFPGPD